MIHNIRYEDRCHQAVMRHRVTDRGDRLSLDPEPSVVHRRRRPGVTRGIAGVGQVVQTSQEAAWVVPHDENAPVIGYERHVHEHSHAGATSLGLAPTEGALSTAT